ncbi:MAG: TonB dependent receptor [Bacteroidota bacterium]
MTDFRNKMTLVLILCSTFFQTQATTVEISGTVVNEQNQPLEIGNVLLLSPTDSTLVKGEIIVDGQFTIAEVEATTYLLKISALGYEEFYQLLENKTKQAKIELPNIRLKTTLLKGVEVIAQKQLYQKRGQNVVVSVANTALSSVGTAMDVLRNSPKVVTNSGGGISVIGKGAALIYLDGQQVTSSQILNTLSSVDIKEIEIIENPSAKYDATGQAVINIITKSKTLEGFKIGLTQEIAQHKYFRSYFKANTYFRADKMMFQASYGIRPYIRGGREHYFRTFDNQGEPTEVDNRLYYARDILLHDYNFRTSYQLDGNSKIGLQYTGSMLDAEKDALNQNIYDQNGKNVFRLNTKITGPYSQQNNVVSLFYERTLDTLGSNFLVSGQYSDYQLERLENIDQTLLQRDDFSTLSRQTFNTNDIDLFTLQADWNAHFQNGTKWSSGLKNAYVTNKSLLTFKREQEGGDLIADPNFSSDYDYDENVMAAYSQLVIPTKTVKTTIGLRTEWTKTNGASTASENGKLFERNYIDLFPSVSVHKTFSPNTNATLNYNYRIQRPAFQDLNPFVFYVDSLVSLRGNANLVPEYTHTLSANVTYKTLSFDINYSYTKDKINTIIQVEDINNPNVFAFVRENIDRVDLWSATVSFPIQRGWYSSYTTLGVRSETHYVADIEQQLRNHQAGYYLQTHQSFQLPASIKFDVLYSYTSPRVDGIYRDRPISYLHLGLSRSFFNNHLRVNLWGNDILDTYKFRGTAAFNQSNFSYLSEGDWHYVKLALNWDFGKLGVQNFREKKLSKSELGRINREF